MGIYVFQWFFVDGRKIRFPNHGSAIHVTLLVPRVLA